MKKLLNNIVSKLIIINISYGILDIFLTSFLVSYIMRSFSNPLVGVGVFYIFWSLTVCLGFVLVGDWTKRGNKMTVFRASIVLRIAACVILGCIPLNLPVAIGVATLLGLSDGAMNLPWHNIVSEKLSRQQLIQYSGYRQSVSRILKVVLPVIVGALINLSSYTMMVWMVIPFSVLSFMMSYQVQSRATSHSPLNLKSFFQKGMRCRFTRILMLAEFLRGICFNWLGTIMTMFVVYFLHTDLALGTVQSVQSLFIILIGFAIGRFLTPPRMPRLTLWGAGCIVLAAMIFLTMPSSATLIACMLIYTIGEKLVYQLMEMNVINGSNYNPVNKKNKVEYFIIREGALNVGRIMCLGVMLIMGLMGGGLGALIWLFGLMAMGTIPVAMLSGWVSRAVNKTPEK